jgi:Fe-S-cluster containining protein
LKVPSWLPETPERIEQALGPWRQVAEHGDAFFARVAAANASQISCGPGCNECCHPTLTVLPAEALAILLGLSRAAPEDLAALHEPSGLRCCLLHPTTGRCVVYPLRPLICRTHGLPIQYANALWGEEEHASSVSCCPLNFQREIPKEAVLNGSLLAAQLLVANSLVTGGELGWPERARKQRVSVFKLLERGADALG